MTLSPTACPRPLRVVRTSAPSGLSGLSARDFLDDLYLVCRSCTTRRAAGKINPRRGYAWAIITCGNRSCRQARPANAWNCTCQIPWRSCSFHAQWLTHANTARLLAESPRKERTKRTKWQSLDPPRILAKRARAAEDKLPTALDAQRPPHGPQSTLNQGVDRAGNDPFFSNQKGGGACLYNQTPPPLSVGARGAGFEPAEGRRIASCEPAEGRRIAGFEPAEGRRIASW